MHKYLLLLLLNFTPVYSLGISAGWLLATEGKFSNGLTLSAHFNMNSFLISPTIDLGGGPCVYGGFGVSVNYKFVLGRRWYLFPGMICGIWGSTRPGAFQSLNDSKYYIFGPMTDFIYLPNKFGLLLNSVLLIGSPQQGSHFGKMFLWRNGISICYFFSKPGLPEPK
jgi:hypothetical protein